MPACVGHVRIDLEETMTLYGPSVHGRNWAVLCVFRANSGKATRLRPSRYLVSRMEKTFWATGRLLAID